VLEQINFTTMLLITDIATCQKFDAVQKDTFAYFVAYFKTTLFCYNYTRRFTCVVSSFRRCVNEIFTLLGYYAAQTGSKLPTFRDDLSIPSSRVK
jgi:hypothetical protein